MSVRVEFESDDPVLNIVEALAKIRKITSLSIKATDYADQVMTDKAETPEGG